MAEDRVVLIDTNKGWTDGAINATPAPKDNWRHVWLVCLLFGVGGLLPWNVFITCYDFFYHKYVSAVGASILTRPATHRIRSSSYCRCSTTTRASPSSL